MKDKIYTIALLIVLLFTSSSFAQLDANQISNKALEDAIAQKASWQLTLDVIKAKSDAVFNKNEQLNKEAQALAEEYKTQQEAIVEISKKNQEIKDSIKQRRGRSDEQIKIEELQLQIKSKKEQLNAYQKEIVDLQSQIKTIEHKIELKKLKNSEILLQHKQESLEKNAQEQIKLTQASEDDAELIDLKQKFEHEKQQESFLQKQLDSVKQNQIISSNISQSDVQKVEELQKKVDFLAGQKEDLQKRLNNDNNQSNKTRYQMLMLRKGELEQTIKESEIQLSQLKQSRSLDLSESKPNKSLLKQMVQIDTKNKNLQRKVGELKEDITVLRTQIKRLERKVYQRSKTTDAKK